MLRMLFQLLESVKNWAFEFEHDVDFIQRINRERSAQEKSGKNC
jgi:transposase